MEYTKRVKKWGVFEYVCQGPEDGNPFIDYWIKGKFVHAGKIVETDGFYDGNGIYRVRFMPAFEGEYSFFIEGSGSIKNYQGNFFVEPPEEGNHGSVRVANTFHFAYEDGTPYYSVGTTCYVWELQNDSLIEKTLENLRKAHFNKIRFCMWPKHYDFNLSEPRSYPYEGKPMDSQILNEDNFRNYTGKTEGNHWDFTKFCPEHFRHIEKCVLKLQALGIEADVIVMHPYDRWGFSSMTAEQDDLYWKYVLARFSAYRNIWWSLANEYDLLTKKTQEDWERYARIICEKDPYNHLRSIHNCRPFYDYSRPWITHCSIQRQDLYKTAEMVQEWRERFKKPVIVDEMAYEGNLPNGWGNITGQEMVKRFWEAFVRGGYAGHGETYLTEEKILWWSHGGELHGESWKRLEFLHKIMLQTPGIGLKFAGTERDDVHGVPEDFMLEAESGYRIYYYSFMQPCYGKFYFDDDTEYKVEVIDTWNMTITNAGIYKGHFKVVLPGTQYMAIRIQKANWKEL